MMQVMLVQAICQGQVLSADKSTSQIAEVTAHFLVARLLTGAKHSNQTQMTRLTDALLSTVACSLL